MEKEVSWKRKNVVIKPTDKMMYLCGILQKNPDSNIAYLFKISGMKRKDFDEVVGELRIKGVLGNSKTLTEYGKDYIESFLKYPQTERGLRNLAEWVQTV